MDPEKESLNKKYAEVDQRLSKKDYIGNILYFPFDVEEEYFMTIDSVQRSHVLDQLNQNFDVQEKLTVSKRTQTIHIRFAADEEPIPVCVFARWTKGCEPSYLAGLCTEFNSDFNGLSFEERDRLYRELCLTHSEKVVEGFNIKYCNKPGGEWIIQSNRNPISSTKKQLKQPYPKSTTEAESEAEEVGKRSAGMDTCELLVPDISLRTASMSTSVEQVSAEAVDPAILRAQPDVSTDKPASSSQPASDTPVERSKVSPEKSKTAGAERQEQSSCEPAQEQVEEVMEADPLEEDVGSPVAVAATQSGVTEPPSHEDIADQPIEMQIQQTSRSFSNPPAASTPNRPPEGSSSTSKSSAESNIMSGSEFSGILEATKKQREEMERKREDAALKSPIKKAAKDLEDATKSQYLSDYQKIMATGIVQIMQQQDALMGSIQNLLEKERLRQELDDALQRDLTKISSNINKRERSVAKIKDLTQDIYYEMAQPSRKRKIEAVAGSSEGSSASLARAARKESSRVTKLEGLKKLLKLEVINEPAMRLLKSKSYQAYMAEKILFRVASSTDENIAATYNKVFLNSQFSRRFIAFLYWGDDNRVSNVNWHSVPLPKPAVQLWNTIAQELCNHDKKLVRRLKQTRKQHLNDTKKERNEAWRISHSDRHVAEAKLYEDYEDFYHLNKDYRKLTRPNDKPPGMEVHKASHMQQKGVKKQYAYSEDSVVAEPPELVSNAGQVCTDESVDEVLASLMSLGYGLGRTPKEMSAEHTEQLHPIIAEQAEEVKVTKRGSKKKHHSGSKKAQKDSDSSSDVSDTSLESEKEPSGKQSLKRKKKSHAKKDDNRSKYKSSSKKAGHSKAKESSSKHSSVYKHKKKKHSSKKREVSTPSKKRREAEEEQSVPSTSKKDATPSKKRRESSSLQSPAKKSETVVEPQAAKRAESPPRLPLFARDPSEKITKTTKKKVLISDAPPKIISRSPVNSGSSGDSSEESSEEGKTASQKLASSKTISDYSQTSYRPEDEEEEKEEESKDSYVSGSDSEDSSSSGSSSASSEVKVLTG